MAWGQRTYQQPGAWKTLRRRVLERDRHTCQACGHPAEEVDHVVAPQHGGSHDLSNLVALCSSCHGRKTRLQAAEGRRARKNRRNPPPPPHPGLIA
ncbi:MAG: HNH endonuclease [Nocardioides sp.]|nr:HNH endonuclease [Nocardioides sp.]